MKKVRIPSIGLLADAGALKAEEHSRPLWSIGAMFGKGDHWPRVCCLQAEIHLLEVRVAGLPETQFPLLSLLSTIPTAFFFGQFASWSESRRPNCVVEDHRIPLYIRKEQVFVSRSLQYQNNGISQIPLKCFGS